MLEPSCQFKKDSCIAEYISYSFLSNWPIVSVSTIIPRNSLENYPIVQKLHCEVGKKICIEMIKGDFGFSSEEMMQNPILVHCFCLFCSFTHHRNLKQHQSNIKRGGDEKKRYTQNGTIDTDTGSQSHSMV